MLRLLLVLSLVLLSACSTRKLYSGDRTPDQVARVYLSWGDLDIKYLDHQPVKNVVFVNTALEMDPGFHVMTVLAHWGQVVSGVPGVTSTTSSWTQYFYPVQLTLKAGHTYVPWVEGNERPPRQVCLAEEPHDAPGVVTSSGLDGAPRTPSPNARKICAPFVNATQYVESHGYPSW
ncbi:hypothetical protein D0B54_06710 [Solimonas sp. K1W22B-7]|uniref:hypothetical protein n=1 Tax=Solimonas sp. K1W22B-7 TaxID=2303331 RepID=UPI000E332780|nr:hypothetical protein [Solimonas sp. K1W22B-7]AXQ28391.1 hypothetical protein D0B54_06710 [Solimonas sp. K1W22B-7]